MLITLHVTVKDFHFPIIAGSFNLQISEYFIFLELVSFSYFYLLVFYIFKSLYKLYFAFFGDFCSLEFLKLLTSFKLIFRIKCIFNIFYISPKLLDPALNI